MEELTTLGYTVDEKFLAWVNWVSRHERNGEIVISKLKSFDREWMGKIYRSIEAARELLQKSQSQDLNYLCNISEMRIQIEDTLKITPIICEMTYLLFSQMSILSNLSRGRRNFSFIISAYDDNMPSNLNEFILYLEKRDCTNDRDSIKVFKSIIHLLREGDITQLKRRFFYVSKEAEQKHIWPTKADSCFAQYVLPSQALPFLIKNRINSLTKLQSFFPAICLGFIHQNKVIFLGDNSSFTYSIEGFTFQILQKDPSFLARGFESLKPPIG